MLAVLGWARSRGAAGIGVLATRANTAAGGLYSGMGMTEAGGCHYRIRQG